MNHFPRNNGLIRLLWICLGFQPRMDFPTDAHTSCWSKSELQIRDQNWNVFIYLFFAFSEYENSELRKVKNKSLEMPLFLHNFGDNITTSGTNFFFFTFLCFIIM